MQSRAVREGSVGLLLLLGFGIVVGSIAWLRGANLGGTYSLAVELPDALGLDAGSPVKYRGVKVGRVRSLSPQVNGVIAKIEIAPASLTIPRANTVSVTQSGFIGQVELSIQPTEKLSNASTSLSPFEPNCDASVIVCDGDRLSGSVGTNFDELIRATTRLATILGDSQIIDTANTTLKTFSTTARDLSILSRGANRTLKDVSSAARGFTSTSNEARQQLRQFGSAANSVTQTVNKVGTQFEGTAVDLSQAANQVTGLLQTNRGSLVSTLDNLQDASQDLKVAVRGLSPVISRIEKGKLLDNLETLAENGAKASASLKSLTSTVNNPATLLGLAQTLDSARVTFQNTQKITTDLEQVTGNPQFRDNLIRLINGLSKLVSSTETLDRQLAAVHEQPASNKATSNAANATDSLLPSLSPEFQISQDFSNLAPGLEPLVPDPGLLKPLE
jgi:phospholipid/cholesterol/gamma-HCH transport system substrate-binding protein